MTPEFAAANAGYCAALLDGEWHQVGVPPADLRGRKAGAHLKGVLPKGPERGPLSPRAPFGEVLEVFTGVRYARTWLSALLFDLGNIRRIETLNPPVRAGRVTPCAPFAWMPKPGAHGVTRPTKGFMGRRGQLFQS